MKNLPPNIFIIRPSHGGTGPKFRAPAYENAIAHAAGLMMTCNGCDRIIYQDEHDEADYTAAGGYCKECRAEHTPAG